MVSSGRFLAAESHLQPFSPAGLPALTVEIRRESDEIEASPGPATPGSAWNRAGKYTSPEAESPPEENRLLRLTSAAESAYPVSNGKAGGKLPSGNATVRVPPRSFSEASR